MLDAPESLPLDTPKGTRRQEQAILIQALISIFFVDADFPALQDHSAPLSHLMTGMHLLSSNKSILRLSRHSPAPS